jgi:hypothetical protein
VSELTAVLRTRCTPELETAAKDEAERQDRELAVLLRRWIAEGIERDRKTLAARSSHRV